MKSFIIIFVVFHLTVILMHNISSAYPLDNYSELDDEDAILTYLEEYINNDTEGDGIELNFADIQKRKTSSNSYRHSCVPRGRNCDHRPKNCCNHSSCRCNLWGVNCKCQRMGYFQMLLD